MSASSRKRLMIIDGFNVLRSGSRYRHIEAPNPDYDHDWFNTAREALVNDVVHYTGSESRAVIVFDGGGNSGSTGDAESIGPVEVMFSPAGSSADKVIERLAHCGKENGCEVLVVTSDATIQDTVFGMGVERMSAQGFCLEVERYYEEVRLDDAPAIAHKRTIADRIDENTLAKLVELRDSGRL